MPKGRNTTKIHKMDLILQANISLQYISLITSISIRSLILRQKCPIGHFCPEILLSHETILNTKYLRTENHSFSEQCRIPKNLWAEPVERSKEDLPDRNHAYRQEINSRKLRTGR